MTKDFRKKINFHKVSEKIWLSPRSIQIESDSSRWVFFTDNVWIVGPLGQAISLINVGYNPGFHFKIQT